MQSDNFVTLFYNKRLGIIKAYCTGKQDMSYFGEEQQDFELIYDFIVVPRDVDSSNVMRNKTHFSMNLTTKEIEKKEEFVSKYKVQAKKVKKDKEVPSGKSV